MNEMVPVIYIVLILDFVSKAFHAARALKEHFLMLPNLSVFCSTALLFSVRMTTLGARAGVRPGIQPYLLCCPGYPGIYPNRYHESSN